jgi:LDH2 family malate/lactate/ureidoglycolate dehydrogenase
MLSMFKEDIDGPYSIRRILAFILSISSIGISVVSLNYARYGWIVFLPPAMFLIASIVLLFFTTWTDITALISATKNIHGTRPEAFAIPKPTDKQPSDLG